MGNSTSGPEQNTPEIQRIKDTLAADTESFNGGNYTSEAPYDVKKENQPYYKEYMKAKAQYLAMKNKQNGGANYEDPYENTMYVTVSREPRQLHYKEADLDELAPTNYRLVSTLKYEYLNNFMNKLKTDLEILDHINEKPTSGPEAGSVEHVAVLEAMRRLTANGTNKADLQLVLGDLLNAY